MGSMINILPGVPRRGRRSGLVFAAVACLAVTSTAASAVSATSGARAARLGAVVVTPADLALMDQLKNLGDPDADPVVVGTHSAVDVDLAMPTSLVK